MNRYNDSFKYPWLQRYPWLVYSLKVDGVFCVCCALLDEDRGRKGALVNKPFTKWTKMHQVLSEHAKTVYHCSALSDATHFTSSIETQTKGFTAYWIDQSKAE